MRYLVHIESIDTGEQMPPRQVAAFIEDVVQPTIKALIQWPKDGKAKCGILSGVAVASSSSTLLRTKS